MIELLNIDCMEYMAKCKDKEFDLAIVDPPYGIGGDRGVQKNNGKWGYKLHRHTDWDSEIPTAEYFKEVFRVSKNQIVWGGNYFTENLPPKMCWLCWDKMQTDFTFSDFELAWTSFDTKCKKFDLIRGFDEKGKHYSIDDGRIHPTQKPKALYKWLLHNYAKKGDKIFDSHGGSMSSAIACHEMGFDLVLCEIDKDYYDAGVKRYNNAILQQKLFNP